MIKLIGDKLWQWDTGRQVQVSPEITEVHFGCCLSSDALIVEVVDGVANIPNIMLQRALDIQVWGVLDGQTICETCLDVTSRIKPSDYVYTETEVKRYETLENRIETLEKNGVSDERIESVIKDYLEENPIETGATKEQIEQIEKNTQDIANKANVIVDSADGNNIVLTDSTNEKARGMKLFGKSEQTTIGGNQLLAYPYHITQFDTNGVICTDNGDGSLHIKGTATKEVYFNYFPNEDGKRLPLVSGTYTISVPSMKVGFISGNVLDGDGNRLTNEISLTSNNSKMTFTLDKDGLLFLYMGINKDTTIDETIYLMINKGTTALPWEPYTGGSPSPNPQYPQEITSVGDGGSVEVKVDSQTLTVPTPNGLRGIKVSDSSIANYTDADGNMWCCDEIDLERGKFVQRIGKMVWDGSVAFGFANGNVWHIGGSAIRNTFGIDGWKVGNTKNGYYLISDNFRVQSDSYDCVNAHLDFMYSSLSDCTISINGSHFFETLDSDGFKKFFSEHPTTIYVILTTPIETDLADITLPTMNYPTTTLISDAHLHVDYVADTKGYIDKKLSSR